MVLVLGFEQRLTTQALEICGEEDRFRGDKIKIAPLQISTRARNLEQLNQSSNFHFRKDIVSVYSELPCDVISHEEIFKYADEHAKHSAGRCSNEEAKSKHMLKYGNLVFISGQAGIGKTTLLKLLVEQMLDPEVRLYQADIVFYLRFRDLDYESNVDLLQFLTNFAPFLSSFSPKDRGKIIHNLEDSGKVHIIMDGLDEATFNPGSTYPNCNADSITTVATFTYNLLSGHLFPKAKKLVTSRPRQLALLTDGYSSNLYLNLLGISEDGQTQICSDLCSDEPLRKDRILDHINSRPDLKSLCYVPITCIMIMMSLYSTATFERSKVDTLTAILIIALEEWFLKKLKGKFQIREIAILAFDGLLANRFSFREFHLKSARINFENTTAFLTNNIKFQLLQGKAITYFAHLMWQEFFVAIKLRLFSSVEEFKDQLNQLDSNKFEVATRFLFGLCNKQTMDDLLDCVDIEELNTEVDRNECEEMLKQYAIEKLVKLRDEDTDEMEYFASILPILGWVREMGDDYFSQHAASCLKDEISIVQEEIFPSDVPSLNHILRARHDRLLLTIEGPNFVGNCSKYFYKELRSTLNKKPNIQVCRLLAWHGFQS